MLKIAQAISLLFTMTLASADEMYRLTVRRAWRELHFAQEQATCLRVHGKWLLNQRPNLPDEVATTIRQMIQISRQQEQATQKKLRWVKMEARNWSRPALDPSGSAESEFSRHCQNSVEALDSIVKDENFLSAGNFLQETFRSVDELKGRDPNEILLLKFILGAPEAIYALKDLPKELQKLFVIVAIQAVRAKTDPLFVADIATTSYEALNGLRTAQMDPETIPNMGTQFLLKYEDPTEIGKETTGLVLGMWLPTKAEWIWKRIGPSAGRMLSALRQDPQALELMEQRLAQVSKERDLWKAKYEAQKEIDSFTGVHNKTSLHSGLVAQELEQGLKEGKQLIVGYLDGDSFGAFNDIHPGKYNAGDDQILRVSNQLQLTSRSKDYLVRDGGEEFVFATFAKTPEEYIEKGAAVLSPEQQGVTFGRRVQLGVESLPGRRQAVAEMRAEAQSGRVPDAVLTKHFGKAQFPDHDHIGTLSIGVTVSRPGETLEEVLQRAAKTMSQAKQIPGKQGLLVSAFDASTGQFKLLPYTEFLNK